MVTADTEIITLNGAKIVVETLKQLGVECIFGYPGGIVLSVYDELFKQNDIKHYLVRHEQSAVHAAEGYARVSGKCGVVLVTSGPGAANTVSGIANAYLDGYPLVVLTGQVFSSLIGKDAFQEVDIVDITKSCTKAAFQVKSAENLQNTLVKAFDTALSGKKGPVVVDIAKNVFTEHAEFHFMTPSAVENIEIKNSDISKILFEISNAKRPVIVSGGGVVQANASEELFEFAKLTDIPVVNTLMGLGTYPQDDKNYAGMIGIFGSFSANSIIRESDLVLSFGARFNDRVTCCFANGELERKFIQVDINEKEISRNVNAYMSVVADAKQVLNNLIAEFESGNYCFDKTARKIWNEKVYSLILQNKPHKKISNYLHSHEIVELISEFCNGINPVVTTDVGQHQMFTAQNYRFNNPRKFLTSGGSGTMGFGLPAAIGASIAQDGAPVVCITGDGSFQMNLHELATCVDYNIPVKIFVLNNGYLGMVRQLQDKFCGGRFSQTSISNPDFVMLAKSYGIISYRISKHDDVMNVLQKTFEESGPVVVDVVVEPMESV